MDPCPMTSTSGDRRSRIPMSSRTRRTMSAISRTVKPEYVPMGGAHVLAIQLQPSSRRRDRRLLYAAPSRREPREDHAQDQRHQRQPAEHRHQHRAANGQPAPEMHVVAEESGGAPLQTPRASGEPIGVRIDFGHVVRRADRHRAERPRVRVGDALVIHRDVEKSRRAERLARRLDFLQMAAERFLALVEAEDRLERRGLGRRFAACDRSSASYSRLRLVRSNAWCRIRRRRTSSSSRSSDSRSATSRAVHCSTIDASRPQS